MELEWFIGILSLFDDQLKWVVFDHLGSFSILIIALLIPLIPWWFHFYGPNEVWNGFNRCFDIVEVKDIVCCWMNTTPWKQNGISLRRECCLLDCDLLTCWINRWIRLWNEMIGWFCRLFLLSSDNLSVEEESCESANPWIRDLISFVVISIILSTGDMEWPSWLLLFLPSHQKAIPIQSIFSNPSIQLIHRIETTSIESTYLETWFLSIHHAVIHFDSQRHSWILLLETWMNSFTLYSLSPF